MEKFLDFVIHESRVVRKVFPCNVGLRANGNKKIIVVSDPKNTWKIKIEESPPIILTRGGVFEISDKGTYYLFDGETELYLIIDNV